MDRTKSISKKDVRWIWRGNQAFHKRFFSVDFFAHNWLKVAPLRSRGIE